MLRALFVFCMLEYLIANVLLRLGMWLMLPRRRRVNALAEPQPLNNRPAVADGIRFLSTAGNASVHSKGQVTFGESLARHPTKRDHSRTMIIVSKRS